MAGSSPRSGYGFGTFQGVYTPSLLTILGVVMYLRFGWVLGNVGLAGTLLIVTLSTAITFLTGLSIAALATNMRIGGGGAYYMISRSLGLEVGAAVGLPLFFAQALGISFYIAGFSESIHALVPALPPAVIGVGTLVGLAALAARSADLALKSQYFILALIGASLVSFFMGAPIEPVELAPEAVPPPERFWVVFSVFFPAVTGIEAGIALSGDLKDPARSLPLGTLGAVLTGYAVYIAIPIFLGYAVSQPELLRADPLIMARVSVFSPLIMAGLWGATLSSAMGALLGAPRTLQALARDKVIPPIIGVGYGDNDDPLLASAIAFGVALAGVLLGDLNLIAPVLSMFFLTSYGLLNLSSGLAALIGSPSWRPRFKVSWWLSLVGAAGCLLTMVMINVGATLLAGLVSGGVYLVMSRREQRLDFDDIRRGILMLVAQGAINNLDRSPPDERNWRPNLLVLSGSPQSRWHLVDLARALSTGRGLMTMAAVLPAQQATPARARQITASIRHFLDRKGVQSLVKVHIASAPLVGARELLAAYGFGPLVPNTLMMGTTSKPEHFVDYARLILLAHASYRNVIIVREAPEDWEKTRTRERIDVWWGRKQSNAGLMLTLGYLLKTSPSWDGAQLVMRSIVDDPSEEAEALTRLKGFIETSRLQAAAEVTVRSGGSIFETIRTASAGAGLVLLGMRAPTDGEQPEPYADYYSSLIEHIDGLPPTALVLAAEDLDFHSLFN
ncbi:MAG: Na-K-Cl cotransporter [Myxococcota bacterium]